MTFLELAEKYPQVDPSILRAYKKPDSGFFVNDGDIDLEPIWIELPKAPDYGEIEGFGLLPKNQKYKRPVVPQKLVDIERSGRSIDEIWEHIQNNYRFYVDEIAWIKLQVHRRIFGYWVFINGKPTYITGWQYFYLGFWQLDHGYPEYRDRDRKFFQACWSWKDDPQCFGAAYPKHRREGATSKAQCINYCIISYLINARGGIQSLTDSHAQTVFEDHLVRPWKTVPFFFKPNYEGSTSPKSELSFNEASVRISGGKSASHISTGLGSAINFRPSGEKAYDTYKLHFYHGDEVGKAKDININKRWKVVKPCLSQGRKIHGFSLHTSTVDEMDKGGGRQFFNFCEQSNYHKRNKNGQTSSGLYTLFIPATEGLDGFVDEFGNSVINTPEPWQVPYLKEQWVKLGLKEEDYEPIGSMDYLLNIRSGLLEEGNHQGLSEQIRQFPIKYRECFRTESKDSGFNITILETRLDELRHNNPHKQRGNFEWEGGVRDTRVIWKPDENGRWWLSKVLEPSQTNRMRWDEQYETFAPINKGKFVAGSDPFKFNSTKGTKKSNGGGAVFYKFDASIDGSKPKEEWESYRFVCTYSHRPDTKEDYAEDMLMMCVYFGCEMNTEVNVPVVWDHFESRGYRGFLFHKFDHKKKEFSLQPGENAGERSKQGIFQWYLDYIEHHGMREKHDELLSECKDIDGPKDMTNWDRFAAGGWAGVAAENINEEVEKIGNEQYDLDDFYGVYANSY